MRVAFVGAHGIGKGQIIREIKKWIEENNIKDITFIEDVAAGIIHDLGKKPVDMEYDEKNVFQSTVFFEQILEEIKAENFISDRTVLDAVVYSKGLQIQSFLKETAKVYLKKYPYDKIYFVKKEYITNDSFRNKDFSDYQEFVQIELLGVLEELNIEYEELIGSHYQRTKKVLAYLSNRVK